MYTDIKIREFYEVIIVIIFIILKVAYVKVKHWNLQPVLHAYDIFIRLRRKSYIVNERKSMIIFFHDDL